MSGQNVRYQAREAFKLDGRAVLQGEVLILRESVARLYVGRGQIVRLVDEPPAVAAAQRAAASKPPAASKPRSKPRGKLETKPAAPPSVDDEAPADEQNADDEAPSAPADEVS